MRRSPLKTEPLYQSETTTSGADNVSVHINSDIVQKVREWERWWERMMTEQWLKAGRMASNHRSHRMSSLWKDSFGKYEARWWRKMPSLKPYITTLSETGGISLSHAELTLKDRIWIKLSQSDKCCRDMKKMSSVFRFQTIKNLLSLSRIIIVSVTLKEWKFCHLFSFKILWWNKKQRCFTECACCSFPYNVDWGCQVPGRQKNIMLLPSSIARIWVNDVTLNNLSLK